MERQYIGPETAFLKEMEKRLSYPVNRPDVQNDNYKGWASRIILRSKNYEGFKDFWEQRSEQPETPLESILL